MLRPLAVPRRPWSAVGFCLLVLAAALLGACGDGGVTAPARRPQVAAPRDRPNLDWYCVFQEVNGQWTLISCGENPDPPDPPDPPLPPGDPDPDECDYDPASCGEPGDGSGGDYGYADESMCQPAWDPTCKLMRPAAHEVQAFRETMHAVKQRTGVCAEIALRAERAINEGKVFMFQGPSLNNDGEPSVGDTHYDRGEIHVSYNGSGGQFNTLAQRAQIFRHEAKHLFGMSEAQIRAMGSQCDP